MSINSKHPLYEIYVQDWQTLRDAYAGERAIKDKTTTYLPPTKGMLLDGMNGGQIGRETYESYLCRAQFHEDFEEAVAFYLGLLWNKPPTIELPPGLEPLRKSATLYGESLELLLRRINEEQLVSGRAGILLDLPSFDPQNNLIPYISLYNAESIINWDDGSTDVISDKTSLNLVVLNESNYTREEFDWNYVERYRVLQLGKLKENESSSTYSAGVFSSENGKTIEYNIEEMVVPMLRGKKLENIPFVFINTKDVTSVPDKAPLLALVRLILAVYRGEADYRQNLFMQGQDTLVVIGGINKSNDNNEEIRVGAGSMVEVDIGGDAKYIGVNSAGLSEQRMALEADCKRIESRSGQLINTDKNGVESGLALQTRIGAKTASLNQIAQTGAFALEYILKVCAEWMGEDPEKVHVIPNLEFSSVTMTGKDLVDYMTARTMGAPLSKRTIHGLLVDKGITKLTFEEEGDIIEEEDSGSFGPGVVNNGSNSND